MALNEEMRVWCMLTGSRVGLDTVQQNPRTPARWSAWDPSDSGG